MLPSPQRVQPGRDGVPVPGPRDATPGYARPPDQASTAQGLKLGLESRDNRTSPKWQDTIADATRELDAIRRDARWVPKIDGRTVAIE